VASGVAQPCARRYGGDDVGIVTTITVSAEDRHTTAS
jgi:hypothetical protein